jgi:hypothetical protein
LVESLRVVQKIGSDLTYAVLGDLGVLAVRRGEPRQGVRLLAAGQIKPLRHAGGWRRFSELVQAESAASLATAKSVLGEDLFASAWAEGRAMTLDQAVADALSGHG